jgi:hypothetical protein
MGQVHLGTQGWNRDSPVGSFFPKATRQADHLRVYSRAFRIVEAHPPSTPSGLPAPPSTGLSASIIVALTPVDGPRAPPQTVLTLVEPPAADCAYVRWMGPDRKIEDFSRVVADFQGHSPANARAMRQLLGNRPVSPGELADQVELL